MRPQHRDNYQFLTQSPGLGLPKVSRLFIHLIRRVMRRFLFCLSLCTLLHTLFAQGLGTWTPYLSYYNTTQVTEANEVVYALANGSLYSYGKEDQSLKYYSRENGLSDNNIVAIQYNTAAQKLLIAYSNDNLDLLGESSTYNLPYLKNSKQQQIRKLLQAKQQLLQAKQKALSALEKRTPSTSK